MPALPPVGLVDEYPDRTKTGTKASVPAGTSTGGCHPSCLAPCPTVVLGAWEAPIVVMSSSAPGLVPPTDVSGSLTVSGIPTVGASSVESEHCYESEMVTDFPKGPSSGPPPTLAGTLSNSGASHIYSPRAATSAAASAVAKTSASHSSV